MKIDNSLLQLHDTLIDWRKDLHAHPETAFEEKRTSDFVAARLESFGLKVHRGLATTGVVATLSGQEPPSQQNTVSSIALRADMDALDLDELNRFDHRSSIKGKMHACGHDGHTVMLLGAAKVLADNPCFSGQVHFIFQPAEENEGGGRVMVEEGLFELFPTDMVFGMHNWPGLAAGHFAIKPGPMMASTDRFEIILKGDGAHAAMPHLGSDSLLAASALMQALQSIISRNIHPQDSAVVSVTQIHGGETWNVIPASVTLRGTARSFTPAMQEFLEQRIGEIARNVAFSYGCSADYQYYHGYPAVINDAKAVEICQDVVKDFAGDHYLETDPLSSMGGEDFAFMLQKKAGAYIWIGNGMGEGGCLLHNPKYDFNDDILPIGAQYWISLVQRLLKKEALI